MFPHMRPSKKVPRLLLVHKPNRLQPLSGLQAVWKDRTEADVYDLSFGGMVLSPKGTLGKVNPEQQLPFQLRVRGIEDPVSINARIARVSPHLVGLIFDSNLSEGRLVLEQTLKDRLVADNLKETDKDTLPAPWQGAQVWFHGPFDTNILIWNKPDSEELQILVIEYDNVVWIYDRGELNVQRSFTAIDEGLGYFHVANLTDASKNNASLGASWMSRLQKLLKMAPQLDPETLERMLVLLNRQSQN